MFSESTLYDQDTFYKAFMRDLLHSKDEVIIESPFITYRRMTTLLPIFVKLRRPAKHSRITTYENYTIII